VATKSSAGGGKCSAGVPESGCPSRPIVSGTVQIQAEIHAPWAKEQQDSVIAAAILVFGNFIFLTVGTLKRVELRLHAKFCRNRSKRGSGFNGLTEYLHNRIGLIGLGL